MKSLFAHLWAVALLAVLALGTAAPAFAHAQLLTTMPAANAIVADPPPTVTLGFNEPVSPLVITLVSPDGATTDLTTAATSGETLVVPLPDSLGQGTHVLSWRVVSVDAHPIAGALVFSIGTATGAVRPDQATTSSATSTLLWASKLVLFSGLFLGLGGAIFSAVAPMPNRLRPLVVGCLGLGLVAAPMSLGLHGADALGLDPGAILSPSAWSAAWSTSYGLTVLVIAASIVLGLVGLLIFPPLAFIAWPLAALSLALSGHAGAAAPQALTRTAVTLHAAGILFWAGALLPLLFALRDKSPTPDAALARFSRLVPYAVLAILASGIVLAVVQLGPPGAAWLTPYAYILAAKLALLAILFALAAWNRLRLTGPTLAGDATARHRLRLSIAIELVLILIILALAAGWRFTAPPRAIAAAEAVLATPVHAHAMDDRVTADIVVTPGHAGPVDIEITVTDIAGEPLTPASVDLTFSAPALGIEPIKSSAQFVDGVWRIAGQTIPLPGLWEITLDIRIDRFTLSRIGTDITLQ